MLALENTIYSPPPQEDSHYSNSNSQILLMNMGGNPELSYFDKLGEKLILYILKFLDYKTVCRIAQVNKVLKQYAYNNFLWKELYTRKWPSRRFIGGPKSDSWDEGENADKARRDSLNDVDFKNLYRERLTTFFKKKHSLT